MMTFEQFEARVAELADAGPFTVTKNVRLGPCGRREEHFQAYIAGVGWVGVIRDILTPEEAVRELEIKVATTSSCRKAVANG